MTEKCLKHTCVGHMGVFPSAMNLRQEHLKM